RPSCGPSGRGAATTRPIATTSWSHCAKRSSGSARWWRRRSRPYATVGTASSPPPLSATLASISPVLILTCVDRAAPRLRVRFRRLGPCRRLLPLRPVRVPAAEKGPQLISGRLHVEVESGQALAVHGGIQTAGLRLPPSRPLSQPLGFDGVVRCCGGFVQCDAEHPDLLSHLPLLQGCAEVLRP